MRSWIIARSNSARPAACSTNASGFLLTNEIQSMDKGVPPNDFWEGTMKPARRQFLHLAAGAATMPAMLRVPRAQALSDAASHHGGSIQAGLRLIVVFVLITRLGRWERYAAAPVSRAGPLLLPHR
jgi:hypothetical protein